MRLLDRFKRKTYTAAQALMSNIMGWEATESHKELIEKAVGWAYACVDKNTVSCAQTPLKLYVIRPEGDTRKALFKTSKVGGRRGEYLGRKLFERIPGGFELEEVVGHPIIDFLRNPHPRFNLFELKYLTFAFLEVTGNAYWLKNINNLGLIESVTPLWPQLVTPEFDDYGNIAVFKYGNGEKARRFNANRVIHFAYPSLTPHALGDGPMKAAVQAVDLLDYMNRYEIASFKNGGSPGYLALFEQDAALSKEDEKRISAHWRRNFGGVDNSHKLYLAQPGIKDVRPFGMSPKEMSYVEGRQASLEEVCAVFGVPTSFVLMQDISRANAWASMELYYKNTIMPKLALVEQKLNQEMTPLYDENLVMLFDDPLPKDNEFRLKEREANIRIGYTVINEERAEDGLGPVPWGDEPRQQQPVQIQQPEKQVKRQGPKNELPNDDFVPVVMRSQLVVFFEQLKSDVMRKVERHVKSVPMDILNAIFDKDRWTEQFKADVMPFVKGLLTQGVIDALEKVNPEAMYNANAPEVLRALERRESQIISVIDRTTNEEVRKMVTQGIEDGLGPKAISRNIQEHFDVRHHAERVARTETIWAHNEGTMIGWKQSGVVRAKQWDTAPDERRCPFCAAMHGRAVLLDAPFYGQGDYMETEEGRLNFDYEPIEHPPLHPNCRCALLPILED